MASFVFNLEPRSVTEVNTPYRRIRTKIPVPESLPLLQKIRKYESGNAVEQLPVVWDHAKGAQIFDKWGNSWIDFTSSIFVTNAGHGSPYVIDEVEKLLEKPLLHSYYYPTEIRADFLEALITFTPSNLEKAILLSAGTEATERAIKIARIFGSQDRSEKTVIVGWDGNYHGKTLGAQLVGGQHKDKNWIGFKDPGFVHLPFPYPWVLEEEGCDGRTLFHRHLTRLEEKGVNLSNISALFAESFQGWGAIFYPESYIQAARAWASENNALLVFDEIQAGFGRTGQLFAYQHYDVDADLVICGKGISGSLPLSAVLGSATLIELDDAYTSTHGGNPLACAAGLGTIKAFESLNILDETIRKESLMREILSSWRDRFPDRIGSILGRGLLFGVFIKHPNSDSLDEHLTNVICERAMEKGVFSICTGRGTLKLGPPLTIADDALTEGLAVYEECFEELF
jgi:4-aminobutyrate aminotransferase/(S)-3-amino-2-methylpropionate transaminase